MLSRSLWESALELQSYMQVQGFRFCFIGGVAVQRWGEPRVTDGLDLTLFLNYGDEQSVAKQILARYQSRHPNPLAFVMEARILLLHDISGTDIDLSLGGMPYEERMMERSSDWQVRGHGSLTTCSAEDLVILKSFASRPQDWIDVEKTIIRQSMSLYRAMVREELEILASLKDKPEILAQLELLFQKHNGGKV